MRIGPMWLGVMLLCVVGQAGETPQATEITGSITLEAGRIYGPMVVKASNITIDGRGAELIGAKEGPAKEFKGVGILAKGVSNIILKNVKVKGFETGLRIEDGSGWIIEGCDFSDNFHDPEFGWGENGRRGGIVLERVRDSVTRKNKANRVWDACVLVECNGNRIEENDFSRTSNTCLKLWASSRNRVEKNNLSYGIRIKPGEVHARDSTSVLIETGSNDNRFLNNDCTHGGDGIFIRVLNNMVSTGNHFEGNDCSYANNNCVEAWSPRNTYVRNKANHGSYGFWLGASDQTVLLENEASYNGLPTGMHNSPHLPGNGHAGIVFMFGPSSHTVVRGNRCIGNNGAGIALIGDLDSKGEKWKAFHWIIEQNTLEENRWGIYMQYADWIDVAGNRFRKNSLAEIQNAGNVTNLFVHAEKRGISRPPKAVLTGPNSAKLGQTVVLDAKQSSDPGGNPLSCRWDLGDGTTLPDPTVRHIFDRPGFHRIGLTVNNGFLSDLAWRDFYVVEDLPEIGTEGGAASWGWIDPQSKVQFVSDDQNMLCGRSSVRALVQPYSGGRVSLMFPKSKDAGRSLAGKTHLVFWLKTMNENLPAWQDVNPVVTIYGDDNQSIQLTPAKDLLSQQANTEAREGWSYFVVPLAGDQTWKRKGEDLKVMNYLAIGFDSWGAPPLRIWIDGLGLK